MFVRNVFLAVALFTSWSAASHAYSYSGMAFPHVVKTTGRVVVGTYESTRYGKNGEQPIMRHVFSDVTIYTKNNIKPRAKFSLQLKGGIRVKNVHERTAALKLVDDEYIEDDEDAGVDVTNNPVRDERFYKRNGRDILKELTDRDIPFNSLGKMGLLPEFIPGTRYIFFPLKKAVSPISPHVFIVDETDSVYFLNGDPVVGFNDKGSPIQENRLLNPKKFESLEYNSSDGNPSVTLFSSSSQQENTEIAMSLDSFLNTVRPKLNFKGRK